MPFPTYAIPGEVAAVNEASLHAELVAAGPYTTTFQGVNASATQCTVLFDTPPSGANQTTVDGVIAAHTGASTEVPTTKDTVLDTVPPGPANDTSPVGAIWVDTSTSLSYVCVDNSTGAAVWQRLTPAYKDDMESTGVTTTTSTVFQSKVSKAFDIPRAGDYEVTISYTWNHDDTGNDFEAELREGGVPITFHKQEPQDSGGADATGTTQRYGYTQKRKRTLVAGSLTYELFLRTDSNGAESSMLEAVMTIEELI